MVVHTGSVWLFSSLIHLGNQPVSQSVSTSINQQINLSVGQLLQLVNQSVKEAIGQSVKESMIPFVG